MTTSIINMDITDECRLNRSCPSWSVNGTVTDNDSFNASRNHTFIVYEFRHSLTVTISFCIAYALVFIIGVVGNCFVVGVVYRSPRMRSPTNLFIANLACADLLVNVLCLPFTLVGNIMSAWIMGWVICKTVPYLQGVSVSASINTLVAISIERCLAICFPLKWQMTSRACRVVVVIIWTFSLIITLPWAIFFGLRPLEEGSELQICTESWPSPDSGNVYFVVAHLVMCYLFPLTLISVCYLLIWRRVCRRTLPGEPHPQGGVMDMMIQRSKVKVIKMLLVVVVSFALSWLPLYVLFTRVKFGGPFTESEEAAVHALLPVAQWLGASNSCVNPILYAFFNKKFRAGFKAIVTSKSCCKPIRYNNEYYSTSVKSTYSCRMNTKNGSVLMSKKAPVNPSSSMKTKILPPSENNLQRHHSASAVAVYKINKVNENYNNNYSSACKNPPFETGHHIIRSSSVSALTHLNATSV